ncbi:hypothetical protein GOP47_0014276 [Adiantum capillus-veneris]|uniref:Protein root UVB sensitive 5 n=1 Tax=Adiantum capillus-veneris TaxID=13818 RepID=A0A9D4UMA7_ADICA|nr:hypothetical protein GOP47_0014276 [Adiantum capillus-veneris]
MELNSCGGLAFDAPISFGGRLVLPRTRRVRSLLPARSNQETPSHTTDSEIDRNSWSESTSVCISEQIGDALLRKYILDEYQFVSIEEIPVGESSKSSPLRESGGWSLPANVPKLLKDFFLPTDFPESVSSDYLQYMLLQFPTNITGWTCSTLVTSSLLKAVGLEAWAGTTVAATAAIKWVSKDGLGAFGRLFVGGRFGRVFDDDPKQWRMYAELIGSFGSVFELITPVKPEWFFPLAALGRLTKAVGKGLKDPSFRVIQNHFAIAGNMGEVSAKEEVWEVSAELIGIAFGVAILSSPGVASSYSTLVLSWATIRALHLYLRYQSLASLVFSTVNFKRAFIMAELHIMDSPIPGLTSCNMMENILLPWQFTKPYLHLGCSLKDAVDDGLTSMQELEKLLALFSDELHVLILNSNAVHKVDMRVIFKEGATSVTVLRCIWQSEWIMKFILSKGNPSMALIPTRWTLDKQLSLLAGSLEELKSSFDDFLLQMEQAGWETSSLVLKIPKNAPFLILSTSPADSRRKLPNKSLQLNAPCSSPKQKFAPQRTEHGGEEAQRIQGHADPFSLPFICNIILRAPICREAVLMGGTLLSKSSTYGKTCRMPLAFPNQRPARAV